MVFRPYNPKRRSISQRRILDWLNILSKIKLYGGIVVFNQVRPKETNFTKFPFNLCRIIIYRSTPQYSILWIYILHKSKKKKKLNLIHERPSFNGEKLWFLMKDLCTICCNCTPRCWANDTTKLLT